MISVPIVSEKFRYDTLLFLPENYLLGCVLCLFVFFVFALNHQINEQIFMTFFMWIGSGQKENVI